MKNYALLALAVALVLVFIPSVVCASDKKNQDDLPPAVQNFTVNTGLSAEEKSEKNEKPVEIISVFLPEKDKSEEMEMRDYIISCVAGEMPAVYEPEALCAQALACVTLARYMQKQNGSNKDLKGGDIAADPKRNQGYMSVEEMKSRWGGDFDMYYEKLCNAVDRVIDYTLTYKGETALTAFHAMSSGMTESAADVWGKGVPYLISVDSSGDKSAEKYLTVTEFSPEEIKKKLSIKELPQDENLWVCKESYSKAGRLKTVEIGGKEFTGDALRSALDLRSSALTVSVKEGKFVFEARGYGHGVGMSQTGAQYMAKQGCTWQEIIEHYYPGCEAVLRCE